MAEDSFRRWQSAAIGQKQTASTLLLGLSSAMLAFSVGQIKDATAFLGFWQSVVFHVSAVLNVLVIASGVGFALNRSRDFDLTSRIARTNELDESDPVLSDMRGEARQLGRLTRKLYFAQGVLFVFATISFFAFIFLRYRYALYPR